MTKSIVKDALCLYGIVGGMGGKNGIGTTIDFETCYKSYKKRIFDLNKVDIFMHSWSIEFQQPLEDLYQPKGSFFENQKQFIFPALKRYTKWPMRTFTSRSRWYSQQQSIRLKQE
ncbi:hypothetical protein LCGC14_1329860, partial [marine sediment metagenome]